MPFTPYHFGAGILGKAISPRRVSLTAFVCTQVAIDCETLYYLVRDEKPEHRFCHTLVGGSAVGLGVAMILGLVASAIRRWVDDGEIALGVDFQSEASTRTLVAGGLYGGMSHAILDAMYHSDARPFWPWLDLNPWLSPKTLAPEVCVAAGVAGLLIWWARAAAHGRGASAAKLR